MEDTATSEGLGASSDTDDVGHAEQTEAAAPDDRSDTDDDGPKPIPTIIFPPVLPISSDLPPDGGSEDDEVEAGVTESDESSDFCTENNGGCDQLAGCREALDGPECGDCPAGYVGSGASGCAPGLLGLDILHGSSTLAIDASVGIYEVKVPVFIQNITLSPLAPADATLSIRGGLIASGTTWTSPPLDLGTSTITILIEQVGQPTSTYTLNVTRGGEPAAYVKASNTGAEDGFGYSIALSSDGNTLAIGAPGEASNATGVGGNENNDDASGAGAVYVFVRNGSTWAQQAYIKASNTDSWDSFGGAIALSSDGNTLAVGARGEDSNATGPSGTGQRNTDAPGAGAVYIFIRSGSAWVQQAYVKASNTDSGDNFGFAVALSSDGNMLAVGAVGEGSNSIGTSGGGQDSNDVDDAGAVYVFTRSGNTWAQQAYLKASNTGAGDYFGWSVALSSDGSTLAVGARYEDSNSTGTSGGGQNNNDADNAGAVYVFTRSGNTWAQQAYLKASNTGAGDYFGWSIALSSDGDTLVVGAAYEGSSALGTSGADQDNDDAIAAGAVYVFTRSGNTWVQQAYLKASNTDAGDSFGWSIALSGDGNTLAVGARGEDSNATGPIGNNERDNSVEHAGAVYVFTRNNTSWTQSAYLKASYSAQLHTEFGERVALSSEGSVLAVGAGGDSSNATGANGMPTGFGSRYSGAVYVYR